MKETCSCRNFVQSGAFIAAVCAASSAAPSFAQASISEEPSPIHLGLASYTFRDFSREHLIRFMKQLNAAALNAKNVKDHLPEDP